MAAKGSGGDSAQYVHQLFADLMEIVGIVISLKRNIDGAYGEEKQKWIRIFGPYLIRHLRVIPGQQKLAQIVFGCILLIVLHQVI